MSPICRTAYRRGPTQGTSRPLDRRGQVAVQDHQATALQAQPRLARQGAATSVKLTLCSPQTTGAAAGEYCPIWLGPEAPVDQRLDDGGSLLFDTAPLAADVEILGAAELNLALAVDRPQANLAVRLCDVHPGGEATRVTYGLLNLCHRDGSGSHRRCSPARPTRWAGAGSCGLSLPERPPHPGRNLDRLLADDVAVA